MYWTLFNLTRPTPSPQKAGHISGSSRRKMSSIVFLQLISAGQLLLKHTFTLPLKRLEFAVPSNTRTKMRPSTIFSFKQIRPCFSTTSPTLERRSNIGGPHPKNTLLVMDISSESGVMVQIIVAEEHKINVKGLEAMLDNGVFAELEN